MDEELEYECPECGASLPAGTKFCTTCEAEFDWDGDEKETVDELLEEITKSREPEEEAEEEGANRYLLDYHGNRLRKR